MVRRITTAALLALGAIAVFVPVTTPAAADPLPLSAPQCWGRCSACTSLCSSYHAADARARCEEQCFTRNDRCCEAAGLHAGPHLCGCS